MGTCIACTIATISTIAFMVLWFWVVRKELYAKENMVAAVQYQLTASRETYDRVRDGPEGEKAMEIFKRSQSIYKQAVEIYNKTLHKPFNAIPALLLGFRQKERMVR